MLHVKWLAGVRRMLAMQMPGSDFDKAITDMANTIIEYDKFTGRQDRGSNKPAIAMFGTCDRPGGDHKDLG